VALNSSEDEGIHMSTDLNMTFPFQDVSDAKGMKTYRPVIPLRLRNTPPGHFEQCLVDTGAPNTFLDWQLAPLAGVNLSRAEKIPDPQDWGIGGEAAEELWGATVALTVPNERYIIQLGDVPVIFVRQWLHPGFTAVLGTGGMKRIGLVVDAGAGSGQTVVVQR
jgi:hypothetical protein